MIISNPYGGIGNRIKCLISSMTIDEDIKLIWDYKTYDGGVWCQFKDLFENEYEEFFSEEECVKKYSRLPIFKECRFFDKNLFNFNWVYTTRIPPININHLDLQYGNNWGNHIPIDMKNEYLRMINKLIPVKYVRDKIEEYSKLFDENTVSVSIRTWKDVPRTRETKGKTFSIEQLYKYLDNYPNSKFFVTCDNQETFDSIIEKYGNRILYTKKRTNFGDYYSSEGLQDALVDLYLSGKNKTLLSSYGSSFCELQWWFGGGKSETVMMDLHPEWGPSIP
jgi:hypothetical protein